MKTFDQFLEERNVIKKFWTKEEAKEVGDKIGINWDKIDLEQFRMGLSVETEHDTNDPRTDVAKTEVQIGKIALAHLEELDDYYTKLKRMENQA